MTEQQPAPMTAEQIAEIVQALDAATRGPWELTNLGDLHITKGYRQENGKHSAHWIADVHCDEDEQEE